KSPEMTGRADCCRTAFSSQLSFFEDAAPDLLLFCRVGLAWCRRTFLGSILVSLLFSLFCFLPFFGLLLGFFLWCGGTWRLRGISGGILRPRGHRKGNTQHGS